ncbi:hypothetical protein [Pseudomonas cannabina]|uniref:Uncharacterized protein n=1 Tax=Pseudomonas cannabina pv. alisalensis TaxID=757414 RepID=A0ABS1XI90_PSEC1|nr:hypothetical protein [Pseudomonas cannabina]MBM0141222.1 hypothetical protein [Pseudomonas cannabina pv. alisalensis]
MNITPNYITAQEWQSLFEKKDPAVLVPMTKLSIEPEPAKQRDPNAEFYRKEETPWFAEYKKSEEGRAALENMLEETATAIKNEYLKAEAKQFDKTIHHMFDDYHEFKEQLRYLNPELSKKHFGFTLGFNEQIQVTDPDEVLTPAEFTYLTEALNSREQLKNDLKAHAKIVMGLLDHYSEKFDSQYKLNLENYSKVIDYGQIFSRNHIVNYMDTIIYQIERNAPKHEDEEERKPLIDIHA